MFTGMCCTIFGEILTPRSSQRLPEELTYVSFFMRGMQTSQGTFNKFSFVKNYVIHSVTSVYNTLHVFYNIHT